jgi:hypothetical protein
MAMILHSFRSVNVRAVVLLSAGVIAACAMDPSVQQPVRATNPSVTFNYRTDQDLLQANQNATAYCSQYQTAPRTVNITNNADGSKAVVFECVRSTLPPGPTPTTPTHSYTYRTDQELVQASQTAGAYCLQHGSQPMTSNIVINPNGTGDLSMRSAVAAPLKNSGAPKESTNCLASATRTQERPFPVAVLLTWRYPRGYEPQEPKF